MGVPEERFLGSRIVRVNLLGEFPGKAGDKGDLFPMAEAREGAGKVMLASGPGAEIVMLGRGVLRAFLPFLPRGATQKMQFFEALAHGGRTFVLAPHPSGISHWWNDPANREAAAGFWRAYAGREDLWA
jgi:hypothetical protein